MKGLLADCRHAIRLYVRTPGASLVAVVALAVGMAFVGAFLSLYVDLVLRPHPGFEQSSRIVTIGQGDGTDFTGLPLGLIDRINDESTALESVSGSLTTRISLGEDDAYAIVEAVSEGFFEGIRPRLALGRGFEQRDHDPEAEPVIVISDEYWRERFDRDADVIGTTIEVPRPEQNSPVFLLGSVDDDESDDTEEESIVLRIVGVMSPDMAGIATDLTSFWVPIEQAPSVIPYLGGANIEQIRRSLYLQAVGRRGPGVSTEAVSRQLNARFSESTDEYQLQPGFRIEAVNGIVRNLSVFRDTRQQLLLFLTASVLLAVVATANVSLFLLARAPGRRRELGIRMSIGAPLKRLARQLANEAGLLVMVSASLGLLISVWLSNFLRGLAFLQQAQWRHVTLLDWRVLSLVGILLLLLTVFVSLAPILGLRRLGIAAASREVAARATTAQRIAGTLQIAIAGTLGGAAIAFGWYLGSMTFGDPGYRTDNLHAVQYSANQGRITTYEEYRRFYEAAVVEQSRHREAVEAIPGVSAIAFGYPVPGAGGMSWTNVPDPADSTKQIRVRLGSIDDKYLDVLGLRLIRGSAPAADDVGVVLVNQTFARTFFGREDVVGERTPIGAGRGQTIEIIGVLEDLSFEHPSADVEPFMFRPLTGSSLASTWIVESRMTSAELEQQLERITGTGELEVNIGNVRPLGLLRRNLIAADTARSLLTIGTAILVVLLAAFGFYGTQRYIVTAGRREYAIRAALGAGPLALGRLVYLRGLLLSLPGLVVGGLLSFIAVAWLRDDFVSREISPGFVTLCVVAGLTLLLLAASLGPARTARRTQPAPLLRED